MADPTISVRVRAGAAWLDQHDPGWWREDAPARPGFEDSRPIDLDDLDMNEPCRCVLGHRWGSYYAAPLKVADAERFGFDADLDGDFEALRAEWWKVITARRDAERARVAAACCPCRGPVCDTGCECRSPDCPRELAEVLDGG